MRRLPVTFVAENASRHPTQMQNDPITNQDIEDLTLAVIYLTAWREEQTDANGNPIGMGVTNWKGLNFDTLDALAARQYTDGNRRSKAVQLTQAGEAKAQEVIKRLLGKDFTVTAERIR